jgi:hypothetical protein
MNEIVFLKNILRCRVTPYRFPQPSDAHSQP